MPEFLAGLLAALGAGLGLVLGHFWGRLQGKREGRKEAERDAYEETLGKLEAGRKAVRDRRGSDPAERLRRNDGRW